MGEAGGIAPLVELATTGDDDGRTSAAAALANLAMDDDNQVWSYIVMAYIVMACVLMVYILPPCHKE